MVDAPAGGGGTVKLPLVGPTKKRSAIVFGVLALAVAGYGYYRYTQNANTQAVGTDPANNQIDPATGYTYGSSEDAAALQANEAYQYPAVGTGGGGTNTTGGGTNTTLNTPQTNAEWSRACLNYLAKQVGDNAHNVQSALGDYLTGQDVVRGSNEEALILQAVAAYGYPPQPGPKNYPPGIKYAAAPGGKSNPPTPHPPNPVKPTQPVKVRTRTTYYITRHGDTLQKVLNVTGHHETWQQIKSDNLGKLKGISGPTVPLPSPLVLKIKVPA